MTCELVPTRISLDGMCQGSVIAYVIIVLFSQSWKPSYSGTCPHHTKIITSLDSLLLVRLNLPHNIILKNRLSECRQGMSWPTSLHFQFLFVACTSVESETMLMLLIYRYGRFPVIYAVV